MKEKLLAEVNKVLDVTPEGRFYLSLVDDLELTAEENNSFHITVKSRDKGTKDWYNYVRTFAQFFDTVQVYFDNAVIEEMEILKRDLLLAKIKITPYPGQLI